MERFNAYEVIALLRKDVGGHAVETFGRQISEAINWWAERGYGVMWSTMPSDRTFYAICAALPQSTSRPVAGVEDGEKQAEDTAAPVSTEA